VRVSMGATTVVMVRLRTADPGRADFFPLTSYISVWKGPYAAGGGNPRGGFFKREGRAGPQRKR